MRGKIEKHNIILPINCKSTEQFLHFTYKANFCNELTEFEYDHVFVGIYDGDVVCNPAEVMDFKYVSLASLRRQMKLNPDRFTVWFQQALPGVLKAVSASNENIRIKLNYIAT